MAATIIKKYVNSAPIRLLDFGCADGRTLLELYNQFKDGEYVGIDVSEELIAEAPQLPHNITLITADATNLPETAAENFYDVVTALAFIEHLQNPITALKEARRVLRKGGLLVATCPDPMWDKISSLVRLQDNTDHVTDMNLNKMIDMMQKSGFDVVEYGRFMWAPISLLSYLEINVNAMIVMTLERIISRLHFLNWLFVNQYVVGRKTKNYSI
ncbi:MAG: class I SAM-dependent methyltransferase [Mobilitalea sp.]